MNIRRTTVDFPSPGLPRMNADGLEIRRARWNQLIGSQQTVACVSSWRPSGTPIMGEDAPEENGHSPHTWTVVPRYSFTDGTSWAMPPPRPVQPRAEGPG